MSWLYIMMGSVTLIKAVVHILITLFMLLNGEYKKKW